LCYLTQVSRFTGVLEVTDEAAASVEPPGAVPKEPTSHTEIQLLLLKLGNNMGLDVWAARNDRSRAYNAAASSRSRCFGSNCRRTRVSCGT
jgi:hypothetical protein